MENLNQCISIKESELLIEENLSTKKIQSQRASLLNSRKHEGENTSPNNLCFKMEEKKHFPSF